MIITILLAIFLAGLVAAWLILRRRLKPGMWAAVLLMVFQATMTGIIGIIEDVPGLAIMFFALSSASMALALAILYYELRRRRWSRVASEGR